MKLSFCSFKYSWINFDNTPSGQKNSECMTNRYSYFNDSTGLVRAVFNE
jgi:hypothetical protein